MQFRQQEVKLFYEDITKRFLEHDSYELACIHQVDIVNDSIHPAQVYLAASLFYLPLKTERNLHSIYSETELFATMALIATCTFHEVNIDPTAAFPSHQAARVLVEEQLIQLVELNVKSVNIAGFVANVLDRFHQHYTLTDHGVHLMQLLLRSGMSIQEVMLANILAAAEMVTSQSLLFCQ